MTRKETHIATILLIVFGTSMHFVHHVPFFNHFLSYIFPAKESVMSLILVAGYLTYTAPDRIIFEDMG